MRLVFETIFLGMMQMTAGVVEVLLCVGPVVYITLLRSITMFISIIPYKEYSTKYCQSHKTLLWI